MPSPSHQNPPRKNRSPYEPDRHGHPIEVTVRAAVPADAELIAPIDEARGEGTLDELVPLIRRALERIASGETRRYSCVALVEDRVVGYAKCHFRTWPERDRPDEIPDGWYLMGVEVLPSHRRRGVGRALTLHRIEWLRQRTDAVYYFTGEQNLPSQDLHRALGFVEVARNLTIPIPPPFSNEERHVLSKLTLTP